MNGNRGQYHSAPLFNIKKAQKQPRNQGEGQPVAETPRQSRGLDMALSVIMTIPLPILFLLALFISSRPLRLAFLALTAAVLALMWMVRAFVRSARSTLTVVYAALAAVIAVALLVSPSPVNRGNPATAGGQSGASLDANTNYLSALSTAVQITPSPEPENAAAAAVQASSDTQQRLYAFFQAWARNDVKEMLEFCVPSWVNQQQEPEKTLFQLVLNSTPIDFYVDIPDGSDGDTSRTVTVTAHFNELSGTVTYKRLQVFMQKVNNVWYVNPNSLGGTIIDETAETAAGAPVHVNTTIAPTAPPSENGSGITVYYNPDGGKYYHAVPNCSWVSEKYWPLKDFPYELLNSLPYKTLLPCPNCNPPARPAIQ